MRIVVIADIIMSLDNVIAVAAAANGQLSLLILGLAISIPMIIAGAALIMMILDRYPVLVWLGAMLLGWIAGDVIASDPIDQTLFHKMLDGHIRRRLRALLLRQWRRRRSIARRLVRLGTTARTAWRTVYQGRKRLWALSHTGAVEHALGVAYFQKRGLVSVKQLYRDLRRKLVAPAQLTLALGPLRAAMPTGGVRD